MQAPGVKAPFSHRLPAVGQCIYCGAEGIRLTDEHIVPEGMGGTLILQEASCDPCAKVTSLFERRVMQGFMDHGRRALGVKGKKKRNKKLPSTVTQTLIGADDAAFEVEMPFDKAWKVMNFPLFPLPRVMDPGKELTAEEGMRFKGADTLHFGAESIRTEGISGAVGVRVSDSIALFSFVRLLAKIAHGYHVSVHGMFPLHESPLIPVILGDARGMGNWIGCADEHPLPSDRPSLHLLAADALDGDDGSTCTAIRIKLFAPNGAPTYVAASRLTAPRASGST
jgi:hypothetical protein